MLKIGVSACFMYPDPNRSVFGHKTLAYFEQDMARYLSRQGVLPILIPDLPEAQLQEFLEMMDGLVFQGGADIAPGTYKEAPIEDGKWPGDAYRDQYELKIMDYGFKNQKPILAICRGFQLANVYLGGTLYQDLKTQTSTSVEHRSAELYDKISHTVTCSEKSLLKEIYGKEILSVNSVHHQGVKDLGQGLVIDALSSDDQVIEAFHYENMKENYLLGVQWHPEFTHTLKDQLDDARLIYDHFLNAVKR
jgi:putative glutamine amidotransferase